MNASHWFLHFDVSIVMVQTHTKYLKYNKIVGIGTYIISVSLNKCILKDKRYICVIC